MKLYYKREFTWRLGLAWAIQVGFGIGLVALLVAIMGPLLALGVLGSAAAITLLLKWAIENS